jgi:hypothetical protein
VVVAGLGGGDSFTCFRQTLLAAKNDRIAQLLTLMAALEGELRSTIHKQESRIVADTERYFCPIKHACKILGTHRHDKHFLAYGDTQDYEARLEAFRVGLGKEV